MLLSRGLGIVRLQEMKSAGIHRVKVLGSGDRADCQVCRLDDQVLYPIDHAPVLPTKGAVVGTGCRCDLIAVE